MGLMVETTFVCLELLLAHDVDMDVVAVLARRVGRRRACGVGGSALLHELAAHVNDYRLIRTKCADVDPDVTALALARDMAERGSLSPVREGVPVPPGAVEVVRKRVGDHDTRRGAAAVVGHQDLVLEGPGALVGDVQVTMYLDLVLARHQELGHFQVRLAGLSRAAGWRAGAGCRARRGCR